MFAGVNGDQSTRPAAAPAARAKFPASMEAAILSCARVGSAEAVRMVATPESRFV